MVSFYCSQFAYALAASVALCLGDREQILCGGLQGSIERGHIANATRSTEVLTTRQAVEHRSANKYRCSIGTAVLRSDAGQKCDGGACPGSGRLLNK